MRSSQSERSPDDAGSSSPVAWAHAESYTSSGKLKTCIKLSFSTAFTVLISVIPDCLALLTFSCIILQAQANMFLSNPAGQQNFTSLVNVR